MSARRVCVLTSGGVDSAALMADLLKQGREVHPLFIRCGFRWEKAELYWLRRVLRALACPRLKPLAQVEASMNGLLAGHWSMSGRGVPAAGSSWDSVYLPGRNLILLSYAALFCRRRKIPAISIAVLKGNPFSDAAPAFLRRMEAAATAALGSPIRIEAPYRAKTKEAVARRLRASTIAQTFSCLNPRGVRPCGACSKCEERRAVVDRLA